MNQGARYQRQLILKEWGPEAQEKLGKTRILVIGAGGLGCPALQYLAAAGLGDPFSLGDHESASGPGDPISLRDHESPSGVLGIIDGDTVSITDLHRQILYSENDLGKLKALQAKAYLEKFNPSICVKAYPYWLRTHNILDIFSTFDIIIDASDNFGTRYLVDDACRLLGKPLVYGSVSRFEGQVGVFHVEGSPGYRAWFPEPPHPSSILSCDEAGVLGAVAGVIGNLQALEAIKLATGLGAPLTGQILSYQALYNQFYTISSPDVTSTNPGPPDLESLLHWPYPAHR
jgi:molybdopterin/thiamine biosynthesis adenylyltransferase